MEFNRCYSCMQEMNAPGRQCPHCGYDNTISSKMQATHALPCGFLLHGRYVIGRMLGQDSLGVTYIGWDLALELRVCIKEYFPSGAAMRTSAQSSTVTWSGGENAEELKRGRESFIREARKAVKLRKLNAVVQAWDVFYENDTAYLVMDYVDGVTLKNHLIQSRKPLSEENCVRLLMPVMKDLEEVHARGIIHRGVSPDNLMLQPDGTLVLLDIGAAKDLSSRNGQSPVLVAKKGFHPLEQYVSGGSVGPWTDVYALCATIAYCVTGKLLPTPMDRISGVELDLSEFTPDYAEVLQKGLAIRPEDRIQSVKELAEKLDAVLKPQPKKDLGNKNESKESCRPAPMCAAPRQSRVSRPSLGGLFSEFLSRKAKRPQALEPAPHSLNADERTQELPAREALTPAPLRMADVEFSALFPKRFIKGEYSVLEVYIYEEEKRHLIEEAIAAAEGSLKEKRGSMFRISEESVVRIHLESADPEVQIEGNDEQQVWYGQYLKFDFAVFLEENYPKRQLMFTATVMINDIPATRLRFSADCNTMREQKMELAREDILSAFVSYASQDRGKVAAIIQGMKKARPDMDIFFDVDSLRSGEDWKRALKAEIERRDILFLCWSLSAMQSEWVDREWRYALENKGLSSIEPIPIDPPSICPPPKELSSKHFNDRGLLYMNR